jgi:hypothetical protein
MARGQNPNNPTTGSADETWIRMGQTSGPYGNDPNLDARGDFGKEPRDLKAK